jgi:endonuclease YncB( thermonuclease family)
MERYCYLALVVSVHDGDTFTANFDLGMGVQMQSQKVRLRDVAAPELNEQHGPEAGKYLRDMIFAQRVMVRTHKDNKERKEKYGRWLGDVFVQQSGEWVSVNAAVNEWLSTRSV